MSNFFLSKKLPLVAGSLVVALSVLSLPQAAFAQTTTTFGDLLCNAFENAKPFGLVFQWIAYCCGVISGIAGIHFLRLHADDPRNHKLLMPLMYLGGAMCLLALPSFVGALTHSFYQDSGSGAIACQAGEIDADTVAEGLDGMLTSFMGNIANPMNAVTSITAILAGLFFMIRGLVKATKYGSDPRTHSMHSILTHLGFGALLFTIGFNLDVLLTSLFGDSTPSREVDWSTVAELVGGTEEGMKRFTSAVDSALLFVQVIGAIAFVRGWLLLKKVVEGGSNASLTQGLTHILGGVIAVNIGPFLKLMDKTFGSNLIQ